MERPVKNKEAESYKNLKSAREGIGVQKHFVCCCRESGRFNSFYTTHNVQRLMARFWTSIRDRELFRFLTYRLFIKTQSIIVISTLLFFMRPASVALEATGSVAPLPCVNT